MTLKKKKRVPDELIFAHCANIPEISFDKLKFTPWPSIWLPQNKQKLNLARFDSTGSVDR